MIGQLIAPFGEFKIIHGSLTCDLAKLVTKTRNAYLAELYARHKGTQVTAGLLPAYGFTGKPFAGFGFIGLRGKLNTDRVIKRVNKVLPGIVVYSGTHTFELELEVGRDKVNDNVLSVFGALQHWLRTGEINTETLITCECVDAFLDSAYMQSLAEILLLLCKDLHSTLLVATHNDATITSFIEARKVVDVPGKLLCLPGKFAAERLLTEPGVLYEDTL